MRRVDALDVWRGLDRLAAGHGRTMRIHLAGGEPFADWVRLVSIVRAARDAGLTPLEKIETNAFWATHDGQTRARLELLDALGMQKLVVSTDVFHQEFVPFDRVRRCVEIARRVLGRARVQVRWADFYNSPLDLRCMTPSRREAAYAQALARHKERLTGRAAARLARFFPPQPAEAFAGQHCVREVLHSRHVHIGPDGCIFPGTCAGIILGRVGRRSVGEIWRELADGWREHPAVDAVVCGGSHGLLQRVRPLGYRELPEGYANKCHLCTHLRQFLVDRGLWREHVGPPDCYMQPSDAP